MLKTIRQKIDRRLVAITYDAVMVILAWITVYQVNQNLVMMSANELSNAASLLPVVLLVQITSFYCFRLYRSVWRFASLLDLMQMLKAVACGAGALTLIVHFTINLTTVSRFSLMLYVIWAFFGALV